MREVVVSLKRLSVISRNITLLLLILTSMSGCIGHRKSLADVIPGKEVETLQSAVSISVKAGEHSTGGNGYLIFKQPDRFHLAMLSPFGLTVLDLFSDLDRLTCVLPTKLVAYSGRISELPENSPLRNLVMMKWVVVPPPLASREDGAKEIVSPSGDRFYLDANGFVERKVSPQGDQVVYKDYHNVDGVAFPDSLVITSRNGATVKIGFDMPQVNQPLDPDAFTPTLKDMDVLPLTEFKGF
jgi:hypothetical protein